MKLAGSSCIGSQMPILCKYRHWPHDALSNLTGLYTHTNLVDAQLHAVMRLISGTVRSTPLPWLPLLANIEPSALRRITATDKLLNQVELHPNWPLHDYTIVHPLTAT